MKVKTSFFGPVRRPWPEQSREVEVPEGSDLGSMLGTLGYQPEDLKRVAVVVNGKRRELTFELSPGDDVRVVLLAGGG
jgi:sulfur carrier protein ThiS